MSLLLRNARLIDGDPAVLPRAVDVLVLQGRIASVGSRIAADDLPPGTRVLDLAGRALLPGLIDCHVHLTWAAGPRPVPTFLSDDATTMALRAAANARATVEAGVTTVRDVGGPNGIVFPLRDAIARGILVGPRVVASGAPITTTNGHCHFMGAIADTLPEVEARVREQVAAGADLIKVMATGGNHTPGSSGQITQYRTEALHAAVRLAHEAGLPLTAHILNHEVLHMALDAGVDCIEHGNAIDDAVAARMARLGTWLVPTLCTRYLLAQRRDDPELPPYMAERVRTLRYDRTANVQAVLRHGVRLAAGTDAGTTHVPHGCLATELRLWVEAGMAPRQAIAGATLEAARLLRVDREVGSVEPGKRADLLVVDGDPLTDIRSLERPALVVRDGAVVVDRLQRD
ncbi:MAG TPA: amidohydrolase family protein [Chloroflexota bacterium]